MNTLELAVPVKGTSFPELLAAIDQITLEGWKEDPSKDKGVPFPIENTKHIRSLISSTIKYRYPDRKYSANKEVHQGVSVLMVRRFA